MDKQKILSDMIQLYSIAPSIAFCRVPEIYYLSQININGKTVLDHCCGDGFISQYTFDGAKISAGVDINSTSVASAGQRQIYGRLEVCDASKTLPFEDESFDVVYNNSALEHIPNLSSTIKEAYRVTKRGGKFYFCVLGANFYFKFWPLSKHAMQEYCGYQPVHHVLSKSEWVNCFESAGFKIEGIQYYFNEMESAYLAKLDYLYSSYFIKRQFNPSVVINHLCYKLSPKYVASYWLKQFSSFNFTTDRLNEINSSGLYIAAAKN